MKPKLLLRIAAVLMLIHAVLHTIGFGSWKSDPDPAKHQVILLMTGGKFPFMGVSRNMGEFYDGFGYASSVALLLIATLLWFTSGELTSNTSLARKIVMILAFALFFWGLDELIYFFPFAVTITWLSCLCCFLSLPGLRKLSA